VTGKNNDLLYVSPKTGRAISKLAAGKWVNKLLPLPSFLINKEKDNKILKTEFMKGILLTGFFLSKYADSVGVKLPYARNFFINKIN
jgi:DNA repair protein RecO (recombination protein O)